MTGRRIAITADDANGDVGGCRQYLHGLIPALAEAHPDDEFLLVSGRPTGVEEGWRPWRPPLDNVATIVAPYATRLLQRVAWPFSGRPMVERFTGPVDLVHNTLTTTAAPTRRPVVVTAHDTYPEDHHDWVDWRTRRGRSTLAAQARRADAIVSVSAATKRDVVRHWRVDADRVIVAPLGPPPRPALDTGVISGLLERHGIDGPYLFAISRIDPRKNVGRLIDAYARFAGSLERTGEVPRLVIAGSDGSGASDVRVMAAVLSEPARVQFLGFVPDDDVLPLMAGSLGFVHASLHEGFGLTLLEGMSAGVPIAASGRTSLPEVGGEAVRYFDPEDERDMAEAIAAICEDEELRAKLIAAGTARLADFDWATTAAGTYEAYARTWGG